MPPTAPSRKGDKCLPVAQIDETWVSWALAAAGAFILFLLSMAGKDIRERLINAEQRSIESVAAANELRRRVDELARKVEACELGKR